MYTVIVLTLLEEKMKYLICFCLCIAILLPPLITQAASARCEVVGKKGSVLIMDCGEQAKGFSEKSQVKIKTDRGKRDEEGK